MTNLIGTKKQIEWANEIISDIEKFTGDKVTEKNARAIITFGKNANNINSPEKLEMINSYTYAKNNNLTNKVAETLTDAEYDKMEEDVQSGLITMNVYSAITNGAFTKI